MHFQCEVSRSSAVMQGFVHWWITEHIWKTQGRTVLNHAGLQFVCVGLIYNVAYVWVVLLPSSKKQPPFPSWWQESSSSHLGTAPWWSTIKQWNLCMIYRRSNKWTGWANIWGFYLALAFSFYTSFSIERHDNSSFNPSISPPTIIALSVTWQQWQCRKVTLARQQKLFSI